MMAQEYIKYIEDTEDIILQAPIKNKNKPNTKGHCEMDFDYHHAWCDISDVGVELCSYSFVRRNLEEEFENDLRIKRLTVLALYHTNDVPLPIVEMIQKKI